MKHHISKLSLSIMIYGFFAVLCQLFLILLQVLAEDPSVSHGVLTHRYLPYLEYPLMSVTLLLCGAYLLEYIQQKE